VLPEVRSDRLGQALNGLLKEISGWVLRVPCECSGKKKGSRCTQCGRHLAEQWYCRLTLISLKLREVRSRYVYELRKFGLRQSFGLSQMPDYLSYCHMIESTRIASR
jgi:hypothetical protein